MTDEAREALIKIDALTTQIQELLDQATSLADKHRLGFSFSPAYGMGGYYRGEPGGSEWVSSTENCN